VIGLWTAPVLASDEEQVATNTSLSSFSLTFDFTQTRIPLNPEVYELVAVTGAFLESQLDEAYPGTTVLLSIVKTSFRLMQPFEIILDIDVQNLPTAPSVPTTEELDGAVAAILQDPSSLEALITVVEELPDANVFTTTTAITYMAQANGSSSSTTRSNRNVVVGASAAAAALAALLLLGGGYQQWGGKTNNNNNSNNRKPSNKSYQRGTTPTDGSGQTVAGETCGATTIATKSSHNNNNNNNKQTRFAFDEGMSLTSGRSSVDWTSTPPPPYRRLAAEATGASEMDRRVVTAAADDDDEDGGDEEADCYGLRPLFSDAMYDGSEEEEKQRAAVDLLAQPSPASCRNSNMSDNEAASRSSSDPIDTDDLTIDSYVPLRVVDLIKHWSTGRR
jgi:hypothetical protein